MIVCTNLGNLSVIAFDEGERILIVSFVSMGRTDIGRYHLSSHFGHLVGNLSVHLEHFTSISCEFK